MFISGSCFSAKTQLLFLFTVFLFYIVFCLCMSRCTVCHVFCIGFVLFVFWEYLDKCDKYGWFLTE